MEPELLEPLRLRVPAASLVRGPLERLGAQETCPKVRLHEVVDVEPGLAGLQPALASVEGHELGEGAAPVDVPEDLAAAVIHGDPVRAVGVEEEIDLAVPELMGRRRVNDRSLGKMRHVVSPWLPRSRTA